MVEGRRQTVDVIHALEGVPADPLVMRDGCVQGSKGGNVVFDVVFDVYFKVIKAGEFVIFHVVRVVSGVVRGGSRTW
jgi:hypothetical protein